MLIELISSIAPTNITVLITGESGVGKEVFAKAIHELSNRNKANMISVNCGAIPEGLLESELFGLEKGAFTGAFSSKKGYFELADKGTILLDEIGEMPLQTQVKLLRVLETGEFMRVGSGELQKVDVRVLAATNRDLGRMVDQKQFRKDLYYRLKAVGMQIPALRDRLEDVPLLMEHFLKDLKEKESVDIAGFTEDALQVLSKYTWPGNVRELKNFVETTAVLARGSKIDADMVREHLNYDEPVTVSKALPVPMNKSVEEAERELIYKALVSLGLEVKEMRRALLTLTERLNSAVPEDEAHFSSIVPNGEDIRPLEDMERDMIERALDKYRGNRRKVARALNISERTLYRKIKEYDLAQ